MGTLRDNWRVFLLVGVLLLSTFALFSPTVGGQDGAGRGQGIASEGATNLVYGLQLSGGTQIRAPLVGITAEGVQLGDDTPSQVERAVAGNLSSASVTDVIVRRGEDTPDVGTVEVTTENVSQAQLGSALRAAGYEFDTVREGVTETTRQETVRVLSNKINQAGLSGGSVRQVTTATGENFVQVEVPNEDRSQVIDLVNSRGSVRVDIYYPTDNGTYDRRTGVLTQNDFQSIDPAEEGEGGNPPRVPVSLTGQAAQRFQQATVETGVAKPGGSTCTYDQNPNETGACLLIVQDGRVVNSFGMAPSLAQSIRSGEWVQNPTFVLQTRNFSEAQQVAINLRAGALPASLDLTGEDAGTTSYISPAQGESFRTDSLITGIIAVLAVSGVVFLRYNEVRVAAPMIVTALSEVVILLGFAAAIGYPLDLSVIAGFIAVIGTGVDDLIIIADEVMAEGEVRSRRVFQSRFRKAFWVIGAAAATTIIAMSPLAVLSLGDLQGFAIFTILGVLVGVLLTRPAYGDILRSLLTGNR